MKSDKINCYFSGLFGRLGNGSGAGDSLRANGTGRMNPMHPRGSPIAIKYYIKETNSCADLRHQ